jgi:hypothetical protein
MATTHGKQKKEDYYEYDYGKEPHTTTGPPHPQMFRIHIVSSFQVDLSHQTGLINNSLELNPCN